MPLTSDPPPPSADQILWDVQAIHLDEAEFMFEVWEAAHEAPDYTLDELAAGPEQRLLAHVDGLQLGGPPVAERLLLPTIEDPNAYPERVAASTLALWSSATAEQAERVIAIVTGASEDDQRRGVGRALELVDDPALDAKLVHALDSAEGPGIAGALELLARRRARVGDWLLHYLSSDDPRIARAAAKLVRHCPDRRPLDALAPLAQSSDPSVRLAALETALYRQVPGAWESAVYWAFAPDDSPFRRDALTWVAILGDAPAQQRVLALVDSAEHRQDALWAVGFSGRIAAVDRCIELLADPDVGPLAAEVICAIAGLSAEDEAYWVSDTNGEDEGLPELGHDDLEGDLVPEAEAALPIPEPRAIAQWWHAHRSAYDARLRHLGGEPLTGSVLIDALRRSPLRRRHVLALELGFRTAGELVVGTRGLSARQRAELDGLGGVERVDFQRGVGRG